MKTTTLLIAILTAAMCCAQTPTPPATTITPSGQSLIDQLRSATTVAQVAALETAFAGELSELTEADIAHASVALWDAYKGCVARGEVADGYWAISVLPRYLSDWGANTSAIHGLFYWEIAGGQARQDFIDALVQARTPAEFDALVAAYVASITPAYNARFPGEGALAWSVDYMANEAVRVGHPQALNYALLSYKCAPISKPVDKAITLVALALKTKDMNPARARAWVAGQNTGSPAVALTDAEKATPALLVSATLPNFSLADAKAAYLAAETSPALNSAITRVAMALKARFLNLAQPNAWITAQKNGTAFVLP